MSDLNRPLAGKVALVTGGSRGVGRGTAIELGSAGATVYVTARTLDRPGDREGTIAETAAAINAAGGVGIPLRCDHTDDAQTEAVAQRIAADAGRLDILVNSVYSTPGVMSSTGPGVSGGAPFWQTPADSWDVALTLAVRGSFVMTQKAVPLMLEHGGLIVHIASAGSGIYFQSVLYGLGKGAGDRMMRDMAFELRDTPISCLAVWPGWVATHQTELMFAEAGFDLMREYQRQAWANFPDHERAIDALTDEELAAYHETPNFTGRAIVALAADPGVKAKSGQAHATVNLADEYGFTDLDGRTPDGFRFREKKYWPTLA
jgi:NAD(P)-dependent dehydrogenase (short-subunit alcohol dehydrogenase family)